MAETSRSIQEVKELIFATHNENKAAEVNALMPTDFHVISLKELGDNEDIPETGDTLIENALIKARHIYSKYGKDCFAEDTGLEVEALNGAPGVRTARFAGEGANADDNMDLLLERLKSSSTRHAQFRTVFALILDGQEYTVEGIARGTISKERLGTEGFGYDPVFIPEGYDVSFAQMSKAEKNKISHRGRALREMVRFLRELIV